MLGFAGDETIAKLLYLLYLNDGEALLAFSGQLALNGCDFQRLLDELIEGLYQISVYQCVPQMKDSLECQRFVELATLFSKEEVQLYYQIAINGKTQIALMPSLVKGFDMLLLRMLCFKPVETAAPKVIDEKPVISENVMPAAPVVTMPAESVIEKPVVKTKAVLEKKPVAISEEKPQKTVTEDVSAMPQEDTLDDIAWHGVVSSLKLSGMAKTVLSQCVLKEKVGTSIKLSLKPSYETLLTKPIIERIEDSLKEYFKAPIKLSFTSDENLGETPAAISETKRRETFEGAKQELANDKVLNKIIDTFDAKIDETSVKLLDDVT